MSSTTAVTPEKLTKLEESQVAMTSKLDELLAGNKSNRQSGPFARSGESTLTSRGYQLSRVIGGKIGAIDADNCKVEREIHDRLTKEYCARGFYQKMEANSVLVPFASELMAGLDYQLTGFAREMKEVVLEGSRGADPEEVARYRKIYGAVNRALSWQDETAAGALVGPPLMGELIELLRANEIFMKAGARTLPMPPNGRITYPRQTGASTAYFVGESQSITDSFPTTGDVILQAKKLATLVKIPNELFRFATISVEQFIREDMMRVAALKLDKVLLEDVGSATTPKGLINYAGINTFTAGVTGANGDTLQPEDILKMIGTVEEVNATFRGWVMRPLLYAALANRRSDAAVPGDAKGMFLFNMLRELTSANLDVTRENVGGLQNYPVHKSTQVSKARTKGSATNLSYVLGGDFTDYLVALSGVMELMISTQGDTAFTTDQSWVRGLLFCDGAPRHEASFVFVDNLVVG